MLDGIAFLIVGGYLAGVMYFDNVDKLMTLLAGDINFVEFAIALAALGALYKMPTLHPVGRGLILAAFILIAFRIVSSNQGLVAAISSVAKGQTDPLAAFKKLAGGGSSAQ